MMRGRPVPRAYATTTKPWWTSKTLRFNALCAVLAAVEVNAHLIQPYVPGNIYGWGMFLVIGGNTFLRSITTQGVSLK